MSFLFCHSYLHTLSLIHWWCSVLFLFILAKQSNPARAVTPPLLGWPQCVKAGLNKVWSLIKRRRCPNTKNPLHSHRNGSLSWRPCECMKEHVHPGMLACGVKPLQPSNCCPLCMSPPSSAPAAASQRWRQPLVIFRELASASPLPQPPPTHAHPAHASLQPAQEPGEVSGHAPTLVRAVTNHRKWAPVWKHLTIPPCLHIPKFHA